MEDAPFRLWGLYFNGEIHPPLSVQHKCILKIKIYFTKWVEPIPTQNATNKVIINFLEEHILAKFGFPHNILTNYVVDFKSTPIVHFCE